MPAWILHKGYFYKVADGEKLQVTGNIVGITRPDGRVVATFAPGEDLFAIVADKQPTFSKPEVVNER